MSSRFTTIIFDLDGTLVDVPYDWSQIRAELGTKGVPILSYLDSLEEPERSKKWKILENFEKEATKKAVLKEGIPQLLNYLTKKSVKTALVTNNSDKNTSFVLDKFNLQFDCVLSRESGLWKPSGDPFLAAMRRLKIDKEFCCVVGDSYFDVKAAEEAGIKKIFILKRDDEFYSSKSVELVEDVEELDKRIREIVNSKL